VRSLDVLKKDLGGRDLHEYGGEGWVANSKGERRGKDGFNNGGVDDHGGLWELALEKKRGWGGFEVEKWQMEKDERDSGSQRKLIPKHEGRQGVVAAGARRNSNGQLSGPV